MKDKPAVEIILTPEQRAQLRKATDREIRVVRLSVEELEQRIAPRGGWDGN
jgi:hypothetical protein